MYIVYRYHSIALSLLLYFQGGNSILYNQLKLNLGKVKAFVVVYNRDKIIMFARLLNILFLIVCINRVIAVPYHDIIKHASSIRSKRYYFFIFI